MRVSFHSAQTTGPVTDTLPSHFGAVSIWPGSKLSLFWHTVTVSLCKALTPKLRMGSWGTISHEEDGQTKTRDEGLQLSLTFTMASAPPEVGIGVFKVPSSFAGHFAWRE